MSYRSRQKKRERRAAEGQGRHATRPARTTDTPGRWFLTLVTRTCCCARCGGVLRAGADMVYRHTPRECLCTACAHVDPAIKPRPSLKWEHTRQRSRR